MTDRNPLDYHKPERPRHALAAWAMWAIAAAAWAMLAALWVGSAMVWGP